MAKQLLGKEVTAALNERIKGNVAALRSHPWRSPVPSASKALRSGYDRECTCS